MTGLDIRLDLLTFSSSVESQQVIREKCWSSINQVIDYTKQQVAVAIVFLFWCQQNDLNNDLTAKTCILHSSYGVTSQNESVQRSTDDLSTALLQLQLQLGSKNERLLHQGISPQQFALSSSLDDDVCKLVVSPCFLEFFSIWWSGHLSNTRADRLNLSVCIYSLYTLRVASNLQI